VNKNKIPQSNTAVKPKKRDESIDDFQQLTSEQRWNLLTRVVEAGEAGRCTAIVDSKTWRLCGKPATHKIQNGPRDCPVCRECYEEFHADTNPTLAWPDKRKEPN
jgi:hypothetical protein